MNYKSNKNIYIYILTILLSIAFIAVGYNMNKTEFKQLNFNKSYKAKVISIEESIKNESAYDEGFSSTTINFKAEITNDEFKGNIVEAFQYIDEIVAVNPNVIEIGDKIIISSLI